MSLDLYSSRWEPKWLYAAPFEAPTHELICIWMQLLKLVRSDYVNKVAVVAQLSKTNLIHVHFLLLQRSIFPNPL